MGVGYPPAVETVNTNSILNIALHSAIDPNTGLLQLVGFFPTKPRRIDFAFEFERGSSAFI
jgi:hypothetical protein